MTSFRLNIIFLGVDFDDDDVFEALAELPNVVWRAQGRYAFATATIDAVSALKAADLVTQQVTKCVPSACPIRLDDDLVSIPDVASRIGVTCEAVRNWANGTRQANFPLPKGVVGDAIKVWAWSDVNRWLRENLNIGDREEFATAHDAALINALFSDSLRRQSVAAAAATTWSASETFRSSTETRVTSSISQPTSWIRTKRERVHLSVIDGGVHAAA